MRTSGTFELVVQPETDTHPARVSIAFMVRCRMSTASSTSRPSA
jgi:hypothetical protein